MNSHDERNIPLDPQPESKGLLESIRLWLSLGPLRRNKRDQQQAKAAQANREFREADARRVLSQDGASQDDVDKALRVLGRVGHGSA